MREAAQKIIDDISAVMDARLRVFDVQIEEGDAGLVLRGRVLARAQMQSLTDELSRQLPRIHIDASGLRVLQQEDLPCMQVATNLTGLYEKPGFGGPLLSELYYGTSLQALEEEGQWVRVRQSDGYLGWAYKPYLAEGQGREPTHLVLAPSIEVWNQPGLHGSIVTRLVSGTGVVVEETSGGWSRVAANKTGWMPSGLLRAVNEFPKQLLERRAAIVKDSIEMVGTPYLWGGLSGNGIDCSGLARLVHRWIGIEIPRDADMQHAAAKPVEGLPMVGDLLFFAEHPGQKITHVGISLGGWNMIHSSRRRNGVYLDDLDKAPHLHEIYVSAGSFIR
jgi:cell wall-associated NlpC family hydrolase